ncbi:MAG TPA: hypothetical protein VKB71_05000 [Rhizomicrobium sp.]|nr:hypothetical protein [Rhizomicrobium sp.]
MDAAKDSKDVEELRKRAQWYRDFASVGSTENRALRLSLAELFDRQADALEAKQRH